MKLTINRLLSAVMMAATVFGVCAQMVEVTSINRVDTPVGFFQVEISPDGENLVGLTADDMSLSMVSVKGGNPVKITDKALMLGLAFSDDSRDIVYIQETADASHRRFKTVRTTHLPTLATRTLVAPTRTLNGIAFSGGAAVAVNNNRLITAQVGELTTQARPVVSISYGHLMLTIEGTTHELSPNGSEGCSYLWPSVSPDGSKILYYLGSVGAFVCDIDGRNITPLGELRAPRWVNDNMVVGMADHDDGHMIVESSIVLSDLDGTTQTLTPHGLKAMFPSVSADGRRISFTTPEGAVYVLNLNDK